MTKQAEEKASKIKLWLSIKGFKGGRNGYFCKNDYRFKVGKNSIRFEGKIGSKWFLLRSGYFKDIDIIDEKLDGTTLREYTKRY